MSTLGSMDRIGFKMQSRAEEDKEEEEEGKGRKSGRPVEGWRLQGRRAGLGLGLLGFGGWPKHAHTLARF